MTPAEKVLKRLKGLESWQFPSRDDDGYLLDALYGLYVAAKNGDDLAPHIALVETTR